MLTSASIVGNFALCSLGKIVYFSNKTVILHLLFLICKLGWCAAVMRPGWRERDWVPISGRSLNPAVVQAQNNGLTSLDLSLLIQLLAYIRYGPDIVTTNRNHSWGSTLEKEFKSQKPTLCRQDLQQKPCY